MERAEDIFNKIVKDGESAIDEFILTQKSEELFLDFKRSSDNGSRQVLHTHDRNNLAKAISGFGNSEGGVIVWGVDCSKKKDHADVPHTKVHIEKVKRFKSWLEGAVSGCTIPPHIGVKNHCVITDEAENGFVITYIPKSVHTPHQVVGKSQYYIRAGSNFSPTPHGVLAGMFGRRPQPHVFGMFAAGPASLIGNKIELEIGFMIRNNGPVIASDLFITVTVLSHPGDNCVLGFALSGSDSWKCKMMFGSKISAISKVDFRLAPENEDQPFFMTVRLAPPFTKKLIIEVICGSGQSPPHKFRMEYDSKSIEKMYNDFIEKNEKSILTERDAFDFTKNLLKTNLRRSD